MNEDNEMKENLAVNREFELGTIVQAVYPALSAEQIVEREIRTLEVIKIALAYKRTCASDDNNLYQLLMEARQ